METLYVGYSKKHTQWCLVLLPSLPCCALLPSPHCKVEKIKVSLSCMWKKTGENISFFLYISTSQMDGVTHSHTRT